MAAVLSLSLLGPSPRPSSVVSNIVATAECSSTRLVPHTTQTPCCLSTLRSRQSSRRLQSSMLAHSSSTHDSLRLCQPKLIHVSSHPSLLNSRRTSSRSFRLACTAQADSKQPTSVVLTLIRHGESLWNSKNLFTGCVDVPLSATGVEEAIEAGKRICAVPVDLIFTSDLIRAQMTAMLAMTQHRLKKVPVMLHRESERAISWSTIFSKDSEEETIPVIKAYELNERMYGELQGLNKKETADKYGADMVQTWRRSYDIPPPNGESLAMCAERAVAYFKEKVEPELKAGKNVLIAAHGNSLRAIIMYLDSLTSAEVIELELATGIPMLYVFEEGEYKRRGSPISPDVTGVYALTNDLATYREKLDGIQDSASTAKK